MTMDSNVVKFPYGVSRRVHSRKPRTSKNDTPEERAANGSSSRNERPRRLRRVITGVDWDEFVKYIGPDLEQDFMVDAWKLLNRYFRKL